MGPRNTLYVFNDVEYKGKKLKEYYPTAAALNGFLLPPGHEILRLALLRWLAFLIFRLMLFPYWLINFEKDMKRATRPQNHCHAGHVFMKAPEQTAKITLHLERSIYPGTTWILLLLSVTWFYPLTRGMMKSVQKALGHLN